MTSKNLFFKLSKDDLKRRIWVIALFSLILVISFPISTALSFSNYNPANSYGYVINPFRFEFAGISVITIIFAIIAGMSSFSYLHSRTKVDLYHSLPVKRSVLFAVNYINNIIIYLIPYIVTSSITFVIIAFHGKFRSYLLMDSLKSLGINLIFFMILYGLSSIATILTGNIVVAFLGTGVFYLYGFMVLGIKEIIVSKNFPTYSRHNVELDFIKDITPAYHYGLIFSEGNLTPMVMAKLIFGVLLVAGIAYLLFKYRPSEASNKAMSYRWSKPIIKVALLVPIAFYGGQIFAGYSYNNTSGSVGWNIFGIAFVGIVVGAIIEVIYEFDIKAAFKGKRLLFASLLLAYGLFTVNHMDLINYDKFIPKMNRIESASISIDNLDSYINYYEVQEVSNRFLLEEGQQRMDYTYKNHVESRLTNMEITDIKDIYKLALLGIEDTKSNINDHENIINYTIRFNLKNGKEIYRAYRVDKDKVWELLSKLYGTDEMKESIYPLLSNQVEDFKSIYLRNLINSSEYQIQEEYKSGLVEALKKDMLSSTLEDKLIKQAYGYIRFEINDRYQDYYIVSTYTNTISYLESIGYEGLGNIYNPSLINKISIYDPLSEDRAYAEKYGTMDYKESQIASVGEIVFTSNDDIERVMKVIKEKSTLDNAIGLSYKDQSILINVWYSNDDVTESNFTNFYIDSDAYNEIVK